MHPTSPNEQLEFSRMKSVIDALRGVPFEILVFIYPNNDPGSAGIIRHFNQTSRILDNTYAIVVCKDMPRARFLAYLQHAAVLIGNSSSGIIEAASFGTPVINIGDRQKGRERGANVRNIGFAKAELQQAIAAKWRGGKPPRFSRRNIYGGTRAGRKNAQKLARLTIDERLRRKLIAY